MSTRGEMTSKLYRDHYLPRESAGRRAGADGWFLPEGRVRSTGHGGMREGMARASA